MGSIIRFLKKTSACFALLAFLLISSSSHAGFQVGFGVGQASTNPDFGGTENKYSGLYMGSTMRFTFTLPSLATIGLGGVFDSFMFDKKSGPAVNGSTMTFMNLGVDAIAYIELLHIGPVRPFVHFSLSKSVYGNAQVDYTYPETIGSYTFNTSYSRQKMSGTFQQFGGGLAFEIMPFYHLFAEYMIVSSRIQVTDVPATLQSTIKDFSMNGSHWALGIVLGF